MAEFRYALFGDPVVRPLPCSTDEPMWRLSVQTDRVKWFLHPLGPFELDRSTPWPANEVVLRRRGPNLNGNTNIDVIRFVIFQSQADAVGRLLAGQIHFVPSITDPFAQALVTPQYRQQRMTKWNINYLGFRTDRVLESSRRVIAAHLDVAMVRTAAGIPEEWGSHDMAPLVFARRGGRDREAAELQRHFGTRSLRFLYNSSSDLDSRVARAIIRQLPFLADRVTTCTSYAELVELVKHEGDVGMFLYNWYIQNPDAAKDASPAAWRFLYPLFHSRCIGHTNLTRHNDSGDDIAIEAVLSSPLAAASTLTKILGEFPMIVLYHAVRLAAWSPSVVGLTLRDPDCHPTDHYLANVAIEERLR